MSKMQTFLSSHVFFINLFSSLKSKITSLIFFQIRKPTESFIQDDIYSK
jgi:hypothetical protein